MRTFCAVPPLEIIVPFCSVMFDNPIIGAFKYTVIFTAVKFIVAIIGMLKYITPGLNVIDFVMLNVIFPDIVQFVIFRFENFPSLLFVVMFVIALLLIFKLLTINVLSVIDLSNKYIVPADPGYPVFTVTAPGDAPAAVICPEKLFVEYCIAIRPAPPPADVQVSPFPGAPLTSIFPLPMIDSVFMTILPPLPEPPTYFPSFVPCSPLE